MKSDLQLYIIRFAAAGPGPAAPGPLCCCCCAAVAAELLIISIKHNSSYTIRQSVLYRLFRLSKKEEKIFSCHKKGFFSFRFSGATDFGGHPRAPGYRKKVGACLWSYIYWIFSHIKFTFEFWVFVLRFGYLILCFGIWFDIGGTRKRIGVWFERVVIKNNRGVYLTTMKIR